MKAQVVPVSRHAHARRRQPSSHSPWWKAAKTLTVMIRNVAASAVVAIAAAYVTSRGNWISVRPLAQQSRGEYMAATLVATHFIGCVFVTLIHSTRLQAHRLVSLHGNRPRLWICIYRVCKGVWCHIAASFALILAAGIGLAGLPPRFDNFKLEYYVLVVTDQLCAAVCDAQVRHVICTDTLKGQTRQQRESRRNFQQPSTVKRWSQSFRHSLPALLSAVVAGVYVHGIHQWQAAPGLETNLLVAASLLLKLGMQEIAKHYLLKKKVTSLHHMFLVIGVPTVLIDTQVRVVILSLPNSQSSLANSYAMAVVEVAVRVAKIVWLRVLVRRKQRAVELTVVAANVVQAQRGGPDDSCGLATSASNSLAESDPRVGFLKWRQQIVGLYTAETHADMFAEYIAIVCSAAISLFWSNHPHYAIRSSSTNQTNSLWMTLLVQVAIEMAVDYFASVLEISHGIELEHTRGFNVFLGSFFMMLTVVNINMSAVIYVRDRESCTVNCEK